MNATEIIAELERQDLSIDDFAHGEFESPLENLGECIELERVGGSDQGSHWYSVKFFPNHNIYLKVTGCYSSCSGVDFDGDYSDCVEEVRPKEKTITVYE